MTDLMICPKHKECKSQPQGKRENYHCHPHETDNDCGDGCGWNPDLNDSKPCIPYVQFKVGDRVRASGEYGWGIVTGVISKVKENSCDVKNIKHDSADFDFGYFYRKENLELTEEDDMPDKPKYRLLEEVSILRLYNIHREREGECFFVHLGNLMWSLRPAGIGNAIELDKLIEWAKKDPVRLQFLIEKSHIIKEVPQKSEYDNWAELAESALLNMSPKNRIEWAKRMPRE